MSQQPGISNPHRFPKNIGNHPVKGKANQWPSPGLCGPWGKHRCFSDKRGPKHSNTTCRWAKPFVSLFSDGVVSAPAHGSYSAMSWYYLSRWPGIMDCAFVQVLLHSKAQANFSICSETYWRPSLAGRPSELVKRNAAWKFRKCSKQWRQVSDTVVREAQRREKRQPNHHKSVSLSDHTIRVGDLTSWSGAMDMLFPETEGPCPCLRLCRLLSQSFN